MNKQKMAGLAPRSSRRSALKGAIVGATGLAGAAGVAGAAIFISQKNNFGAAHAQSADSSYNYHHNYSSPDSIQTILNIASTAETLAVIFYTHAIRNAHYLDFSGAGLLDIQAALVEEQIHLLFLTKQGAKPLTTKFSFPHGDDTFKYLDKFISTQQLLESLFIAAYLAAGKEFAMLGRPDLVQVAAQIGGVEAEHRAIGRAIGGMRPANNRAFETALLAKVSDAPGVMKKLGFLNTSYSNYSYEESDSKMNGVISVTPSEQTWS